MSAYNPSFIDKKWTILQQLEAIKKWISENESAIEKISETENTANNALSLAQTNEQDIALNESDITELQQNMQKTLKIPINTPTEILVPTILTSNAQNNIPLSDLKKTYLHKIWISEENYDSTKLSLYLNLFLRTKAPLNISSITDLFVNENGAPFHCSGIFKNSSNEIINLENVLISNGVLKYYADNGSFISTDILKNNLTLMLYDVVEING